MPKRLIVGITGASGVIYGIRLLEFLKTKKSIESHLILSESAETTIRLETEFSISQVEKLASYCHSPSDLAAPISSGSFQTSGMVVAPCSMKSLSGIANSYNTNLLIRAADVTLKEGRKLVLCPRETPLHKGHLDLMRRVADLGGILLPPFPAFYSSPETIDDIINHTIGKILDQFDIKHSLFKRWG